MKTAFTPGTKVRFKIKDGALAKIVQYEREGFYIVDVLFREAPDHVAARRLVAHEDDLELAPEGA